MVLPSEEARHGFGLTDGAGGTARCARRRQGHRLAGERGIAGGFLTLFFSSPPRPLHELPRAPRRLEAHLQEQGELRVSSRRGRCRRRQGAELTAAGACRGRGCREEEGEKKKHLHVRPRARLLRRWHGGWQRAGTCTSPLAPFWMRSWFPARQGKSRRRRICARHWLRRAAGAGGNSLSPSWWIRGSELLPQSGAGDAALSPRGGCHLLVTNCSDTAWFPLMSCPHGAEELGFPLFTRGCSVDKPFWRPGRMRPSWGGCQGFAHLETRSEPTFSLLSTAQVWDFPWALTVQRGGRQVQALGVRDRIRSPLCCWVLLRLHGLVFESWNMLKARLSELLFLGLFCFK